MNLKDSDIKFTLTTVADQEWVVGEARPLSGQKFLHFHAVFGNKLVKC